MCLYYVFFGIYNYSSTTFVYIDKYYVFSFCLLFLLFLPLHSSLILLIQVYVTVLVLFLVHCVRKICQKTSFFSPVVSPMNAESRILPLCGKIQIRENLFSGIFYAMVLPFCTSSI